MSTYAIGDVQGCVDALERLLDTFSFDRSLDRLWFVGDLVNRGPDSLATLRLVKGLGEGAVTVLGNHDFHLLTVSAGLAKKHRSDTLDQVLAAPDCEELLAWLRHRPMLHVEGTFAMVHAGLLPQWSVATARTLAGEVETALRGANWREFLAKLYGDTPDSWSEDLRGADRLRVTVNAMARMRFCTAEGKIEFRTKGETAKAPSGFFPWFDAPGRANRDHTLVCGHWSTLGLKLRPDLIALDTGCVWGGRLSGVRLEDRKLFQVPCKQCLTPGK
ncbi:MAG TPA: symmetrical bis(5'-nucleosyl)-tetraphosphatase [Burkholderiales bacterium]|nr:symmetrical bis(5'-nucleosyl)-tetraphosphatase [Burkholderiales bacterium]